MVKCGVKAFEHMSFLFVKILFNGQFIDNHFLNPINYKKSNQNEKNACEMLTKGEFTSLMLEMFKVVYGLIHFPTHFSTFTFLLLFFLTQIESSTIKYLLTGFRIQQTKWRKRVSHTIVCVYILPLRKRNDCFERCHSASCKK